MRDWNEEHKRVMEEMVYLRNKHRQQRKDREKIFAQGIGSKSKVSFDLVYWATEEDDLRKSKRILNVAKRIEQRYRLAHGLPNMGV